jgi:photosystem II oxygen-evolving enhancer protein 2
MIKSWLVTLLLVIGLFLPGCATTIGDMKTFVDTADGYQLLYPNGWVPADIKGASLGLDAIFHDIIEPSQNLSVIISQVSADKKLEDLGSATEVANHLLAKMNESATNKGEISLIDAQSRVYEGKTYYNLEYQVKFPDQRQRHDVASVVINKGKLYTLDVSAPERRWNKIKDSFYTVTNSFSVY